MRNYRYKVISSAAEKDALRIVDYGTDDPASLAVTLSDALYAETYGDDNIMYSASYGQLKRWPVFNVQSTRYVYLEYVDKAYRWMKERLDASEEETETTQHYRYLADLYEIVTDINNK